MGPVPATRGDRTAVTGRVLGGDRWLRLVDHRPIAALHAGRRPAVVAAAKVVGGLAAAAPSLAVATGMLTRRRLSQAIARPRPPAALWLTEPEGFSFPSKH